MNALQKFLLENPVEDVTADIVISERLKGFTFKIKAITSGEYNQYQSICIENPNSPKKRKFNTKKFNELVVLNHTVEPNFKDADWLKAAECVDSSRLINKTLLAGEVTEVAQQILKLSGFDNEDLEEEVEEVKN